MKEIILKSGKGIVNFLAWTQFVILIICIFVSIAVMLANYNNDQTTVQICFLTLVISIVAMLAFFLSNLIIFLLIDMQENTLMIKDEIKAIKAQLIKKENR